MGPSRLRCRRNIAQLSACAVFALCSGASLAAEFTAVDGHEYREFHRPALTKLSSSTLTPPLGAQLSQSEMELNSLQTAAAAPIKELLDRGGST